MHLSELPQELILEIYHCLHDDISNSVLESSASLRQIWLLNVLSTSMVCRSWCSAGFEYLSIRLYSSPLSLTTVLDSVECPISFASTMELSWSRLLLESKQNKLDFHQHVRRLVLNLTDILNPILHQQHTIKQNEPNLALEQIADIENFSESVKTILTCCPNIKTVEILYSSHYTPMVGNRQTYQLWGLLANSISDALTTHKNQHHDSTKPKTALTTSSSSSCSFLSHLVLTSREPIQRCPCCAGQGWDHTILPLLQQLPVTTLELDRVVPSRSVLECLAQTRKIHTLVIRGDILIQASRLARYGATISTPPRIPLDFLSQIHTLEIYLHSNHDNQEEKNDGDDDDDDQDALDLLAMFRQTYDIIHPIKSLQRLILHGREQINIPLHTATTTTTTTTTTVNGSSLVNNDVWNKLKLLAGRHQLKSFVLENIPGFRCPSVQSKLQNMFISVEKVNVVYST